MKTMISQFYPDDSLAVLDLEGLLDLFSRDLGLVKRIFREYRLQTRETLAHLDLFLCAGEQSELAILFHRLGGSSQSLKAFVFGDLCLRIEGHLKDGGLINDYKALRKQVFIEFDKLNNKIDDFLNVSH